MSNAPSAPPLSANSTVGNNPPILPTGWKSAAHPTSGRVYYYNISDPSSSVWYLSKIPGYVNPALPTNDFHKKGKPKVTLNNGTLRAKSLHHTKQSFVSMRITRFQEGMSVVVIGGGLHDGKLGYVMCILGNSCSVKLQEKNGDWAPFEEIFESKFLQLREGNYNVGNSVEIMSGRHQGQFGTITGLLGEEVDRAIVKFWSKNDGGHRVGFKHMHVSNKTNPLLSDDSGSSAMTATKASFLPAPAVGHAGGTASGTAVAVVLPLNSSENRGGETKVSSNSSTFSSNHSAPPSFPFVIGDTVEVTNQSVIQNPKYKQYLGKLCIVRAIGVGPAMMSALVEFSSGSASGFSFKRQIPWRLLRKRATISVELVEKAAGKTSLAVGMRVRVTNEIASQAGGELYAQMIESYPWDLDKQTGIIESMEDPPSKKIQVQLDRGAVPSVAVSSQYLIPEQKNNDLMKMNEGPFKKMQNVVVYPTDLTRVEGFPWEDYGAVGSISKCTSELAWVTLVKLGVSVNLPPHPVHFFKQTQLSRISRNAPIGNVPTKKTATSEVLAAYAAAQAATDGSATWVSGDKIEFKGTFYDPNEIPVVDAFYAEEPPIVVIATRVLEEKRKSKKGYLWDMPSDTWLELAVYVHSIFKKWDKRKGLQTFYPTIVGHIPTSRQGRDTIMPPRSTVQIMRQFISNNLFLTEEEGRELVTATTQEGHIKKTSRKNLAPEEPAYGAYEYQEQQLHNYLMGRYVDNNWFCKQFAPPAPNCGCWGNYDQTSQGWCCWSCKIIMPIVLMLLAFSLSMLSAASSQSFIALISLNEQGNTNIFCSRLDYLGSSNSTSLVTIYPCNDVASPTQKTLDDMTYSDTCRDGEATCKLPTILGGLASNKMINFPTRAENVRLNVYVGNKLNGESLTNLKSTKTKGYVGAVKVGYELVNQDGIGSTLSYPPTVFPMSTGSNAPVTGMQHFPNTKYGVPLRPFTPSCTRSNPSTGKYDDMVSPGTRTTCAAVSEEVRFGSRRGKSTSADRLCEEAGVPLSQCVDYSVSSEKDAFVWGLTDGCIYGANGCQSAEILAETDYGSAPVLNWNDVDLRQGRVWYNLPPDNYPGLDPLEGNYQLRITSLVVGVYFDKVVGDDTRQEVEDWMLGKGNHKSNAGILANTVQLGLLEQETTEYAYYMFVAACVLFLLPCITCLNQTIEECKETQGMGGGGGGGGNAGNRGGAEMGFYGGSNTNSGCCNCNHCYWDSHDCSYCYLYNHGSGSSYSSYNGAGAGGGNCNHACDGCCNCDDCPCCDSPGGGCDVCGCCTNCDRCCENCNGDLVCNGNGGCGGDCCGPLCGSCGDCLSGCGGGCENICQGGCELCGNCLNGGCECCGEGLTGCCEACGSCDCGGCGGCDCAC